MYSPRSAVNDMSMFLNALKDTSPDGHNYRIIIGEPVEASQIIQSKARLTIVSLEKSYIKF